LDRDVNDGCACECNTGYSGTGCAVPDPCDAALHCSNQGTTADLDLNDGCVCSCNDEFSGAGYGADCAKEVCITAPAWAPFPKLPKETAEVTSGIVGDTMVVIGAYTCDTMLCDLTTEKWRSGAPRPYCGDHHAGAVIGDAIYIIGGDGKDSAGKIQRFTPGNNKWNVFEEQMPMGVASANIAVVDRDVYMCGGYTNKLVPNCWKKRFPESSASQTFSPPGKSWEKMPPLLEAVHHAAAGTDGIWFFIFGGKSRVGNGNDCGEKYTQAWKIDGSGGGKWEWKKSSDVLRGGTGNAPYINGEFYVIGGESQGCDNPHRSEQGVLPQVRIYNVETGAWRDGPDVTGMHGVYPVADVKRSRILLLGGGPKGGVSKSNYAFQLLAPDLANRSTC
jgi:hypothetical protein